MKGHGDMGISSSHYPTSPHQASTAPRTSRRSIQRNPHDAIPSPSHHGTSSRRRITSEPLPPPVAISSEAVGREGR